MKVVVIGAGAVGTWFGERLRAIGCEVTYAPRDPEHISAVEVDLAVVAVKAYDTPGAIVSLKRIFGGNPPATILTLQNGIGNEEQLAQAFGADAVMAGALTVPVDGASHGKATATAAGGLGLAPVGTQPHNWLIAALAATNLPLRVVDDYRSLKWSKLVLNITANAVCAVLNISPQRVLASPSLFDLEMRALRETRAVIAAQSLRMLDLPRYPVRALLTIAALPSAFSRPVLAERIARGRGTKLPSLLIDLRAEKPRSEIAWLNGAVAAAGTRLGVAVPVNRALTRVLEDITATPALWAKYRDQPPALLAAIDSER